jgi:hypothetical protein
MARSLKYICALIIIAAAAVAGAAAATPNPRNNARAAWAVHNSNSNINMRRGLLASRRMILQQQQVVAQQVAYKAPGSKLEIWRTFLADMIEAVVTAVQAAAASKVRFFGVVCLALSYARRKKALMEKKGFFMDAHPPSPPSKNDILYSSRASSRRR